MPLNMIGLVNLPKHTSDKNKIKLIQDINDVKKNLMTFPEIRVDINFIATVHTF